MSDFTLPKTPVRHDGFLPYLKQNPNKSLVDLVVPFNEYESKLREGFAQYRNEPPVQDPNVNAVPLYNGHEDALRIRARSTADEEANKKYIMPLKDEDRKANGSPAVVPSFKEFKKNFDLFSEQSLVDLDWNNVVVAGSAVVTSLLPVPDEHNESKRALRYYYHQKLAPSSDVDIFLWGLDEAAAIEKIQQIETRIRDSILSETTTVRTKNAITIASQYPIRHVQIVLRLYKNVSEILTGFDVDSSCFAYDGKQVYGTPRGITAFMSQCNSIDLSRRSPSYESRLAKYAHRGFEIYCPFLDRARTDPTIFERAFARTMGLARLLVLERLPKVSDREAYLAQRREERGRPQPSQYGRFYHKLGGNMKDKDPEDVAEWDLEADISNYHTFTVPYGPKITPKKIERLLFSKDLLLNAEWNVKKDRTVNLHRHPCFIGDFESIRHDCCTTCPKPTTDEEVEVAEEESKHYVSGELKFMEDDPGRQAIGSFNPITTDDWLEMAYVGNVEELCDAIVNHNLNFVQEWCASNAENLDRRDHTGRTPLQLAVQSSSLEIVKCLIDAGARMVARLADGMTALHIAAARGNAEIVQALLEKSEANEEAEEEKKSKRRKIAGPKAGNSQAATQPQKQDGDVEMRDATEETTEAESNGDASEDSEKYEHSNDSDDDMSMTQGSFVKVKPEDNQDAMDAEKDDPDVYTIDVLSWDAPVSPLHLAILFGRMEVIKLLIDRFGADVLLPVKLLSSYNRSPMGAIMTLILAAMNERPQDTKVAKALLERGATSAQADTNQITALHHIIAMKKAEVFKAMMELDESSAKTALSHIATSGSLWSPQVYTPLFTAIDMKDEGLIGLLLNLGVKPEISFDDFAKPFLKSQRNHWRKISNEETKDAYTTGFEQPIIQAATKGLVQTVRLLIRKGASVNTLGIQGHQKLKKDSSRSTSGVTLLNVLDRTIRDLQPHTRPYTYKDPVDLLKDDSIYLSHTTPGTYEHRIITKQLEFAKKFVAQWQEDKDKAKDKYFNSPGKTAYREKAKELLAELEKLREFLVEAGAKTFDELHPDYANPKPSRDSNHEHDTTDHRKEPEWFDPSLTFDIPELNDSMKEAYMKLFEAVWAGDEATVRQLTLQSDNDRKPMQIAVKDNYGASPFMIAIARGHKSLAKLILEITQAQYEPDKYDEKRRRYFIFDEEEYDGDSNDSEVDPDDVRFTSELVDDVFTIDNIADLQKSVGSKITPVEMIQWNGPLWMLYPDVKHGDLPRVTDFRRDPKKVAVNFEFHRLYRDTINLATHCIETGDLDTIRLIIRTYDESVKDTKNPTSAANVFVNFRDLNKALVNGHFNLAAELVRSTAVGLPIDDLVQRFGVEEKEKPKHYQGLLIKGKHREDWANQDSNSSRYASRSISVRSSSLLLRLAYMGKVQPVEWALSDTPRRLYLEYRDGRKEDKSLRALDKAEGGFEKTLDLWLDQRKSLALHVACMSDRVKPEEKLQTVKYLANALPQSLEVKSACGHTPLSLAISDHDYEVAKYLISIGADQSVRDSEGRNLAHLVLCSIDGNVSAKPEDLKQMIDLLDKRLFSSMLLDRCSEGITGLTPLARWVSKVTSLNGRDGRKQLLAQYEVISEYLSGEELKMIDGSGQLIMHQCVKSGSYPMHGLLEAIFKQNPQLAFVENATGQTPIELSESLYTRSQTGSAPSIHHHHRSKLVELEDSNHNEEEKNGNQRIWELCQRVARENEGAKRGLVSVLQASEVSRRLANAMKKESNAEYWQSRVYYYQTPTKEYKDEVERWLEPGLRNDVD